MEARVCNLMVHNPSGNSEEIILNQDRFGDMPVGSLLRVSSYELPAIFVVLRIQPQSQAPSGHMEVSLSKTIADAVGLKQFSRVVLQSILEEDARVDFVELSFRKQFVRRGDMLRFKYSMLGRTIYQSQSLTVDSMQASIQDIRTQSREVIASGVITSTTKFVFRSKSARIVWLVQVSAEMFDLDPDGDMFFDKFLRDFSQPVFNKWKSLGVSHMLTVIFFTRTLYLDEKINHSTHPDLFTKKSLTLQDGLYMQDHLKIVIENVAEIDKKVGEIMAKLRSELWTFAADCGWRIPSAAMESSGLNKPGAAWPSSSSLDGMGDRDEEKETVKEKETARDNRSRSATDQQQQQRQPIACVVPSDATHGNLLEAINITLNLLDKHYMDRDLQRTGNSIVVVSAGTGLFRVRHKIAMITKQRMLDNAIGIDFISLSRPPIHTVPLFFVDAKAFHPSAKNFYEVPHWMKVSYLDCQKEQGSAMHLTEHSLLTIPQMMEAIDRGWDAQWARQLLPHAYSAFLSSQLGYFTCLAIGSSKEMGIKTAEAIAVLRETYTMLLPFALRSFLLLTNHFQWREVSDKSSFLPLVVSLGQNRGGVDSWGQAEVDFDNLNRTLGASAIELHQRSTVWQREVTTNLRRLARSPTPASMFMEMMLPDVFESLPALRRDNHESALAASYGSNIGDESSQAARSFDTSHHGNNSTREGRLSNDRLNTLPFGAIGSTRSSSFHRRGLYENILSRKQQLLELSLEEEGSMDAERLLDIIRDFDSVASNCCRPNHVLLPQTVDLHEEDGNDEEDGKDQQPPIARGDSRRRETSIDVEADEDRSSNLGVFAKRGTASAATNSAATTSSAASTSKSAATKSTAAAIIPGAGATAPAGPLRENSVSKANSQTLPNVQAQAGASNVSSASPAKSMANNASLVSKSSGNTGLSGARPASPTSETASASSAVTAAAATPPKLPPKDPQAARLLSAAMNKNKMRKHVVQSLAASGLAQPTQSLSQAATKAGAKVGAKVEVKHGIATLVPDNNRDKDQEQQELESLLSQERRNSINPFRHHDGQKYLDLVTHNRRRWSHVFSQGRSRVDYGLNWKSLTQPAILPLNTDYLPSLSDLSAKFTCDHYQLTFDERDCPFASMEEALVEMVCTRLSHEYQLYQHFDKEEYLRASSSMTASSLFYVLTMGHRIHFIVGDTVAKKILVTQYISKKGRNEEERKEYIESDRTRLQWRYEMWSPQLQRFATISQTFALFPDEFLWNQLDNLILGAYPYDGSAYGKKPRTCKYLILPPSISTEEEMEAYFSKIDQLMDFLKKYIPGEGSKDEPVFVINKDRTLLKLNMTQNAEIESRLAVLYYRQTVKDADNMMAVTRLFLHGYKQAKPNWIYIKHDRNLYSFKAFHLHLEWFACDSWSLDKFINELYRKARSWGLRLVQTPSYFASHDLNVHPLRPIPHIVVPMPSFTIPPQHCSPLRLVERMLFTNSGGEWIFDAERNTDWMALGLAFPNYTDRDRDILQEEALVHAVKTSAAASTTTTATTTTTLPPPTASSTTTGSALSSLSDALRKLFQRRASSDEGNLESTLNSVSSPVASLTPANSGSSFTFNTTSSGGGSGGGSGSGNLLGRAMLKRFDRQYVHSMGLATVRVTANGFLFMLSASARVSDLTIPVEEKVEAAKKLIKQLEVRSAIIVDFYELLVGDIFNQAFMIIDTNRQKQLEGKMEDSLGSTSLVLPTTAAAVALPAIEIHGGDTAMEGKGVAAVGGGGAEGIEREGEKEEEERLPVAMAELVDRDMVHAVLAENGGELEEIEEVGEVEEEEVEGGEERGEGGRRQMMLAAENL